MSTLFDVGGGDHEVLAAYRTYQERRALRAATITNRTWTLAAFIRHIAPRSLLDATADDVQGWLDSRVLSPKSRACDISTLHCFYEFCERQGLVESDPTGNVVKPRLRRTLPRPIATKDLNRAMVFATPMLRAWLALGAFEGLRCAEIAGLRREDIDEVRHLLYVSRPASRPGTPRPLITYDDGDLRRLFSGRGGGSGARPRPLTTTTPPRFRRGGVACGCYPMC